MVLSGKLRPGQRIVQEKLAKHLGVSQGVVRESLLELNCSGLVNAIDNLGIFIVELDDGLAVEALEIREVLEGLAARLCCRRASREDIEELKMLVDRIHALGRGGKIDEASLLDREFHQRIVNIANNGTLHEVILGRWTLRLVLKMSFDVEIVYEAHCSIVEAIEAGHADEAERLMRQHIRSARSVVEQQIAQGTFELKWLC